MSTSKDHGEADRPIDDDLQALYAEPTGQFDRLVLAAGLDAARDFVDRDLTAMNFAGADLRGFDFSNSDLRSTSLRLAKELDQTTNLTNAQMDLEDRSWVATRLRADADVRREPDLPRPVQPSPDQYPRHHITGPLGVLDVGTTKIACLIGRTDSDGTLRVMGFGWQPAHGVRGGNVIDLDMAEKAIRAAVGQAEDAANTRLRSITVNLTCGQPESRLFNAQWPVGGRAVEDADIRGIVNECRKRAGVDGREVIHAIPLSFSLDQTNGAVDPRGLYCEELTARVHIIDAASAELRSLAECLARLDLDIGELVSAPIAAGLATLTADERQHGAILIDMGGGTTGIAVFAEGGQCVYTVQLPVGGANVTNDLARLLSTSVRHAESLKVLYGSAQFSPDDEREMLPVPLVGEEHQIAKVPRSMMVNIIRPRLEETFGIVKEKLDGSGLTAGATGMRVVLTGGACQLAGVRELAGRILNKQVRLGRPIALSGLADSESGPAFATAVGLLALAAGKGRTMRDVDLDVGIQRKPRVVRGYLLEQITEWFSGPRLVVRFDPADRRHVADSPMTVMRQGSSPQTVQSRWVRILA